MWIQQFRIYMTATGGDKKEENVQCSLLLSVAGEDAVEVFNTFNFTWSEKKVFTVGTKIWRVLHTQKKKCDL